MVVVMMLVDVVAVAVQSLVRVAVGVVLNAVGHCECVAGIFDIKRWKKIDGG